MISPNRTDAWLCGSCRGRPRKTWCHPCQSRVAGRLRAERVPDYVALATVEVAHRTGLEPHRFTAREHRLVTFLLVEWGRERQPDGPLKTYDPTWRKYEGVGR